MDERAGDVEAWTETAGGWFEEAYRTLRSFGLKPKPSFAGAWLACGRGDRGELRTLGDLADWLGIARQTLYKTIQRWRLREWAEQLRLYQLRGDHLADVDKRTYERAVADDSTAADRQLYYKRAGLLTEQVTVSKLQDAETLQDILDELRGMDAAEDGE
jgi:hypothetical protein